MKPKLTAALWTIALLALPTIAAAPPAAATEAGGATPLRRSAARLPPERADQARVIVRFRADGALMREAALAATRSGGDPRELRVQHAARLTPRLGLALADGNEVMPRTQVLHAKGLGSSALVERLRADPEVEMAWVDERVRAAAAPNDPRYAGNQTTITPAVGQWYLRPPDATIVSAINAEAAWDTTAGSAAIVVAVLDSGVRADHPDLAGKLLPGYDFVSPDAANDFSTANDGDGRDADPSDPGDWITQAEDSNPNGTFFQCGAGFSSWHGTQTAGLIGAATNNGIGMASVGRNVRILPVRVLGKCGGFLSDVVAGMYWAAGLAIPTSVPGAAVPANRFPARVLNLSLGSSGSCAGTLYATAVSDLVAAGVSVVVAAGNDTGLAVGRPANCPGAIGVGGLRHVGTKVGFSDVGPEISLSAPGGNCVNSIGQCLFPLLTTSNTGTTTPVDHTYTDGIDATLGTSFSSPLVAGAAALMLSINPALTPAQVRTMLRASARAFPTTGGDPGTVACRAPDATPQFECYCTTTTCGAGMLNVAGAVTQAAAARATTALAFATPAAPTPGTTVALDGSTSVAANGRTIAAYAWSMPNSGGGIASFSGATNTALANVVTTRAGSFTAQLTITDSTGATASTSISVTVADPPPPPSSGGGTMSFMWLLALAVAVMQLGGPRSRGVQRHAPTRSR